MITATQDRHFQPWTLLLLVILCILAAGCNLLDSDDARYAYPACDLPFFEWHDHLPNYGFEEGYFYWVWDPATERIEEAERVPVLRNRNHLSIRFHEQYGEAFHDSVLAAYNIEPLWSQTFNLPVPMPGFYRVIDHPAEHYYTTYEDTTLDRLGNLSEVEYVLPTYYLNEQFCDLKETPIILFSFRDDFSEDYQTQILDSLRTADHIDLRQLTPGAVWSPYDFYVTKATRLDPYRLYHHYHEMPYFHAIALNFAMTTRWFE